MSGCKGGSHSAWYCVWKWCNALWLAMGICGGGCSVGTNCVCVYTYVHRWGGMDYWTKSVGKCVRRQVVWIA